MFIKFSEEFRAPFMALNGIKKICDTLAMDNFNNNKVAYGKNLAPITSLGAIESAEEVDFNTEINDDHLLFTLKLIGDIAQIDTIAVMLLNNKIHRVLYYLYIYVFYLSVLL